ncbi:hypothetical protein TVAG_487020 [Trichomonas vaginalis G3]|uniref:Uncharacterized protein n=1 Tax=Trichomonas vaginalis (strain ATCC PRA-98 / G3) TaxID=412133 RepID=A2DZD0_TRIV3|nr:TPR-like family [Trichomonas vaginalis G3]EAY14259.1 hypothetical protein TVAG_487020 [Trichomonas vaginalis G3]KAI5491883.1 TPR-like family [Trichomonas vaginalis G3]|eukprot:XP_001326482.1 hypothetical protein [Trichomonas vaginalis G3]
MSSGGLQIQPKAIIGLRSTEVVNDEFQDLFSDNNEPGQLKITIQALPTNKGRGGASAFKIQNITQYNQISSHILTLCSLLGKFSSPPPYKDALDFIPQKMAQKVLVDALNEFYKDKNYEKFSRSISKVTADNIQTSVLIQLKLVSAPYDPKINLSEFANNEMDPKLGSLFHWYFGSISDDHLACSHYMKALFEIAKCASLAPISIFFPEFSYDNLLFKFCTTLIHLFPRNPILPSVIEKLATFSSKPEQITSIEYSPDSAAPEDDDDSDSFSDLKLIQKKNPATENSFSFIKLAENEVTNPLEYITRSSDQVVVSMDDSPVMITYQIENGQSMMTPDKFQAWIKSHYVPRDKLIKERFLEELYHSPLSSSTPKKLSQSEINGIYRILYEQDIRPHIPKQPDSDLRALQLLPVLHFINIYSQEFFGNYAPIQTLLRNEYICHRAIETGDSSQCSQAFNYLISQIHEKLDICDIDPNMKLRPIPNQNFILSEQVKLVMFLTDITLMSESRSPLTLLPFTMAVQYDPSKYEFISQRKNRIGALYKLYSTCALPPYLIFRAAFALGIAVQEAKPSIAVRFIFEGLYILLREYPMLAKTVWVNSAFFSLAENLELCGKYRYCAECIDNTLTLTLQSPNHAAKAAKIAKKYEDLQRAIFFYTYSVSLLLERGLAMEAIFSSQILAKIYESCGQNVEGIQFLSYLLKDVNQISLTDSTKSDGRTQVIKEAVRPDTIQLLICAIYLCELYLKVNQFSAAETLIKNVEVTVKKPVVKKYLRYLSEKINISRNTFNGLVSMPDFNMRGRNRSQTLGGISATQLSDPTVPLLKSLAKHCIAKNDKEMALFWSELICYSSLSQANAAKEHALGCYLRGLALTTFIDESYAMPEKFFINHELTLTEQEFGSFLSKNEYDTHKLFTEALSSFNYSMICYDRCGNPVKFLEAQLSYTEILLLYILKMNGYKRATIQEFSYGKPTFETTTPDKQPFCLLNVAFDSITLTTSNIIEHLQMQCHAIDKLVRTLMDPVLIIRSQIVNGMFMQFRKKTHYAETYFNYAFTNLKKYFFDEHHFIIRDVGFFMGWMMRRILRNLITLLLTFNSEFINKHLIVFDMFNDMESFYANQHRMVRYSPKINIIETLEVQSSITKLGNPRFPDFMHIIKEYCRNYDPNSSHDRRYGSKEWELLNLIKMNRSNVRLFTQNRLSEDQVYESNRIGCMQMEEITESIRKENECQHLTELPPHSIETSVFIIAVNGQIMTYIPVNGQKKVLKLKQGEDGTFVLDCLTDNFNFSSSIFKSSFLEAVANLIVSVPNIPVSYKFGHRFAEECVKFGTFLFGEIPFLHELEEEEIIPDDSVFEGSEKLKLDTRGSLVSLNTTKRPLVVISSPSLNFIPFELMFPKLTVIRSTGFFKAFRRENAPKGIQRVAVLKWRTDSDKYGVISCVRSNENIRNMLHTLGCQRNPKIWVGDSERMFSFPFALFDPLRTTSKYAEKYQFCDIYPIIFEDYDSEIISRESPLFVFSYADLSEWSPVVDELVNASPSSSFMFIPAPYIVHAFNIMNDVFKRHQKRICFVEKNNNNNLQLSDHTKLVRNTFQFVSTLQRTLISKLKVPISIICPTRDYVE